MGNRNAQTATLRSIKAKGARLWSRFYGFAFEVRFGLLLSANRRGDKRIQVANFSPGLKTLIFTRICNAIL